MVKEPNLLAASRQIVVKRVKRPAVVPVKFYLAAIKVKHL